MRYVSKVADIADVADVADVAHLRTQRYPAVLRRWFAQGTKCIRWRYEKNDNSKRTDSAHAKRRYLLTLINFALHDISYCKVV